MASIFAFVEFYVSPFFIAIALAFLLSGMINYYLMGNLGLEEDRREIGRQALLWSALFFLVALGLFAVSSWLVSLSERIDDEVGGGADVEQGGDILRIPNVPTPR